MSATKKASSSPASQASVSMLSIRFFRASFVISLPHPALLYRFSLVLLPFNDIMVGAYCSVIVVADGAMSMHNAEGRCKFVFGDRKSC